MEEIAVGQKTIDELIDSLLETAWNFGAAYAAGEDTTGWASAEESLRVALKRRIAVRTADLDAVVKSSRNVLADVESRRLKLEAELTEARKFLSANQMSIEALAAHVNQREAGNAAMRAQLDNETETLLHVVEARDSLTADLDRARRLLEQDRLDLIWRAERILKLEVENAALRSQLASQWTPVGDGTLVLFAHPYDPSNNREIDVDGNQIVLVGEDEVGDNAYAGIQLPADLRLCRRTQPAPVQP